MHINRSLFSEENIVIFLIFIFSICAFAIARWMNISLFLFSIVSLWLLIKNKLRGGTVFPDAIDRFWLIVLTLTLMAPFIAIFIGQLFRGKWFFPNYDSPLRTLICIPILYLVGHKRLNVVNILQYALPLSIFATWISFLVKPNYSWPNGRLTTYFVDPLTFGSIMFTLGVLSLISIDLIKQDAWLVKVYKVLGFGVGMYLSVISGSRTGWLALPVVLLLWFRVTTFKGHLEKLLLLGVLIGFTLSSLYDFSLNLQQRMGLAIDEVAGYQWDQPNADASVSMRITFLRIAGFLFMQNPLGGWGDTGFRHLLNAPELSKFSTLFTREFALKSGFHNEIATNMVRSGVWGLLSSAMMFVVPLLLFIKGLRAPSVQTNKIALFAMSYLICVFVSGMSTEVFNLKLTAAFHSMMFTCLMGSVAVALYTTKNA